MASYSRIWMWPRDFVIAFDVASCLLSFYLCIADALSSPSLQISDLNYISFCSQDVVLMRALRDMNLPKFVFEDVPLFLGLIADLFPGLDCPRVRYPNFNDAVEAVLVDNKYVVLPHQVTGAYPETSYLYHLTHYAFTTNLVPLLE